MVFPRTYWNDLGCVYDSLNEPDHYKIWVYHISGMSVNQACVVANTDPEERCSTARHRGVALAQAGCCDP